MASAWLRPGQIAISMVLHQKGVRHPEERQDSTGLKCDCEEKLFECPSVKDKNAKCELNQYAPGDRK